MRAKTRFPPINPRFLRPRTGFRHPTADGARVISSITTLFGYSEFILREVSPESLLATTPMRG